MRDIDLIVWHCSATKPSMNVGIETIRDWHVNGNGWSDVGYHGLIRRDGTYQIGRDESISGAHAKGFNKNSLGYCLEGGIDENGNPEANFTRAQYETMFALKDDLDARYNNPEHKGHNQLSEKACPSINIKELFG